jgi:hypothetical protein
MWKDYQSGEGKAIETVPGFRRRFEAPNGDAIYGIHTARMLSGEEVILIHAGNRLYSWHDASLTVNVAHETSYTLGAYSASGNMKTFLVKLSKEAPQGIKAVYTADGGKIDESLWSYEPSTLTLTIYSTYLQAEEAVNIQYFESMCSESDAIFADMNERKSVSFVFNNRLYIIDGKSYLVYDGETVRSVLDDAYVPTTYIGIIPGGENANAGEEHEQRNILTNRFKNAFVGDGETRVYHMTEQGFDPNSVTVKIDGVEVSAEEYKVQPSYNNRIDFTNAPSKGAEIVIGASYLTEEGKEDPAEALLGCTIAAVFDDRIFFAGNPNHPCRILYCGSNEQTGHIDPSYMPILHRVEAGVSNVPVTALVPVAGTLMALKGDTQQDGSVYYYTPQLTEDSVVPVVYVGEKGLSGVGCLGAATNFLDDPVFLSRLGLEAVGQLSTRNERALEHRSYLVDAKLCNLDLTQSDMEEWGGYLFLLADGSIFLADSRQRYADDSGTMQYEWFYLEGIGVYDGQYPEYVYCGDEYAAVEGQHVPFETEDGETIELPLILHEEKGMTANTVATDAIHRHLLTDEDGGSYYIDYVVRRDEDDEDLYYAYAVKPSGGKTGGDFVPATVLKTMGDNLYFGTKNGVVCSFNFDKRDERGEIPTEWYTFDGRAILCGCAMKMDNCGMPGTTKTTVKKSTVIKTKSLPSSAARVKVRTNRKPYEQISRFGSSRFSFDSMDFSNFSFTEGSESLFGIKEKEKKWVEKQYYIYSQEYMRPFSIYYLTFSYRVVGRFK